MKKKLLILSASMLLASAALVSCNGDKPGQEESSEPESSQASSETIAGKVIIAEDQDTADEIGKQVLPKDLRLEQEVNLEDHVQVTKVSNWSISTNSENIQINGHSFKAIDYGSFTITLTAGTTKRSIKGNVVTDAKLKFNEAFNSMSANYVAYSAFTGMNVVTKDYWMEAASSTSSSYVFEGGINHPNDGYAYPFSVKLKESMGQELWTNFEIGKGYAKTVQTRGFGKDFGELKGSDFIQEFDQEGDPTGYYFLEDNDPDEDGSSRISRLVDSILGGEIWSLYQSYLDKDVLNLEAKYSPSTGEMLFVPVDENGARINSFSTSDGQSYTTELSVESIGEVDIDVCNAWLENPTLPEKLSVGPLKNFFQAAYDAKSYHVEAVGTWYNTSTGAATDCPEYMHFSDTQTALFGNFSASASVNEFIYEQTMIDYADDITPPDDENGMPAKGTSDMYFVYDHTFQFSSTTYNPQTETWSYAPVQSGTSKNPEVNTIWDSVFTYVPQLIDDGEGNNFLDLVSWTNEEFNASTGATKYTYNTFGPDSEVGPNMYQTGITYIASTFIPGDMAMYPVFYTSYLGWWDYMELSFEVASTGSWLKWNMDFDYDSSLHYSLSFVMDGIGEDSVSDAAKTLFNEFVNPAA